MNEITIDPGMLFAAIGTLVGAISVLFWRIVTLYEKRILDKDKQLDAKDSTNRILQDKIDELYEVIMDVKSKP